MKLIAEDCINVGEKLYLFCRDYNLFYSINLDTKNIRLEGSIPNQQFQQEQLCRKMVFYKNEIYFIPYNMECVLYIYNLIKKTWRKINIDTDDTRKNDWLFLQAILVDDTMFLFGGKYSKIVRIDLIKGAVEYIAIPDKRITNEDMLFRGNYIQRGDFLWFPSAKSNDIFEFDIKTLAYKWIEVGNDSDRYAGIFGNGDLFWLAPRKNGDILCWDGKNDIRRFPLPNEYEKECIYFLGIFQENKNLILPALHSNLSLVIDRDTYEMKIESKSYSFVKKEDNVLYKFDLESNLYINNHMEIYCAISAKKLSEYLLEKNIKCKLVDKMCVEKEKMPLSIFLKAVIDGSE